MPPLRTLVSWLGLLAMLAGASPARADTLYVDASLATGADDGSSWTDAFQGPDGLRRALLAGSPYDAIWVARGTYLPTASGAREQFFEIPIPVNVYGGFAGGETSLGQRDFVANATILSGDLAGDDASGSYAENSFHVVKLAYAMLDGFTVRGGNADGPDDSAGGGLIVVGPAASLRHCTFRENRARAGGGGALVQGPTYFTTFDRCEFAANRASAGAAVYFENMTRTYLLGCLIHGNTATGTLDAGALYVGRWSGVELHACTVAANRATAHVAAGVHSPSVISGASLSGSILYFNSGVNGSQGLQSQIDADHWYPDSSCIQGMGFDSDSISSDPRMVDVAGGDFRLTPSSPCVDAGLFTVYSAYDLDGNPRLQDVPSAPDVGHGTGPIMDMGAFEASGRLYEMTCPGDGTQTTSCPCANDGIDGRGCRHSIYAVGGLLAASGRVHPDRVELTATMLRGSVICIFLQGDAHMDTGVVLGDGVRCLGGNLKRIGTATSSLYGVATYPGPADPAITVRSTALGDPITTGSTRWYQVWYRDEAPTFCPEPLGGAANLTSGIRIRW